MYSNMKYNKNICNCLRVILQDKNRKLKNDNCFQRTPLSMQYVYEIRTVLYALLSAIQHWNFQRLFLTTRREKTKFRQIYLFFFFFVFDCFVLSFGPHFDLYESKDRLPY